MCFLIFKLAAMWKNTLYPFPLLITDHVFAAPIYWVEYCQLHQDAKKCEHTVSIFGFCGFFKCLQHQYIGGILSVAPKGTEMRTCTQHEYLDFAVFF
jgi:hypothetical protein